MQRLTEMGHDDRKSYLGALKRARLQALAKQAGVPGNLTNVDLREAISLAAAGGPMPGNSHQRAPGKARQKQAKRQEAKAKKQGVNRQMSTLEEVHSVAADGREAALKALKRANLQHLAKMTGVPANLKSEDIIARLLEKLAELDALAPSNVGATHQPPPNFPSSSMALAQPPSNNGFDSNSGGLNGVLGVAKGAPGTKKLTKMANQGWAGQETENSGPSQQATGKGAILPGISIEREYKGRTLRIVMGPSRAKEGPQAPPSNPLLRAARLLDGTPGSDAVEVTPARDTSPKKSNNSGQASMEQDGKARSRYSKARVGVARSFHK